MTMRPGNSIFRNFFIGSSIILFAIVGITLFLYFTNKHVRSWLDLPIEAQAQSIALEITRPFYHSFIGLGTVDRADQKTLLKRIVMGADWISNMQEPSGRFNYWYNPASGQYSKPYDDNFLRQAGTNYSLLKAFEITSDSAYWYASVQSLDYLNQFLTYHNTDTAYYLYGGKAKLGGIALPMLVMLEMKRQSGDTTYDERLKSLANMVIWLQQKYGTGQYKSTFVYRGIYDYEKQSGWESEIYPGEAMLALVGMYSQFQDQKYLASLEWAFGYYADDRWDALAFIPWTSSAFSQLYLSTKEKKYADFTFRMTDYILYYQNIAPRKPAFGSFFGMPSVFTATYLEGIGAALAIAQALEDDDRTQSYSNSLFAGYLWLDRLQYKETMGTTPNTFQAAVGGFRTSLSDSVIRIDNTQHAISALATGYQFIR